MSDSNQTVINRSVKILHKEKQVRITKLFAKRNLSPSALKYAEEDKSYYYFSWGTTSYLVVYEIPSLFNANFLEVIRALMVYAKPYVIENKLSDEVIYRVYQENLAKKIVH